MLKQISKKSGRILTLPSLGFKMTGAFTVMGLIIGYLSLIIVTIISTHSFIKFTGSSIIQKIEETYGHHPEQFLLTNLNQKNPELTKIKEFMTHMTSDIHSITDFSIYFKGNEASVWQELFLDKNHILRMNIANENKSKELKKAKRFQIAPPDNFFLGQNDKIYHLFNISAPNTPYALILELEVNRKGLFHLFHKNILKFILFGMLIILVSSLLGFIFSRRLLIPLKIFSEKASEIAAGNYSKRFHLKRKDEIGILADSLNKMAENIEAHIYEISDRMKTMETMNQIDKAVLSSISRNDLMDSVVSTVSSLFDTSSVVMLLYNEQIEGFDILSYYKGGAKRPHPEVSSIKNTEIPDKIRNKAQTFFQYTDSDTPPSIPAFFRKFFTDKRSVTNSPIFLSDRYLGSLIIAKDDSNTYSETEIESIKMLSDQIGVAMGSVRSFEEKENLLVGILIALTKSVDAKSRWTAGHSERVGKNAKLMGLKLGLNEKDLHTLTISAILHDIGKIAIPEKILDKPSSLTPEEYRIIKEHPQKGADIISDIPSYADILPGILYHHERWDGKGYPKGLKGSDIPLFSRIIAICDVYDSVTYNRPYRNGMIKKEVLHFMEEYSGKLFDPKLAHTFLEILEQENLQKIIYQEP